MKHNQTRSCPRGVQTGLFNFWKLSDLSSATRTHLLYKSLNPRLNLLQLRVFFQFLLNYVLILFWRFTHKLFFVVQDCWSVKISTISFPLKMTCMWWTYYQRTLRTLLEFYHILQFPVCRRFAHRFLGLKTFCTEKQSSSVLNIVFPFSFRSRTYFFPRNQNSNTNL